MSQKTDLFDLSHQNVAPLESRYLACISKSDVKKRERLEKFATIIKQMGRISINFRLEDCTEFLTTGKHLNCYELAEIKAKQSGQTLDAALREHLKTYYSKRKGFSDTFENEQSFRYGALNIGGVGSSGYGEYCAILKSGFPGTGQNITYIKSDSLNDYVDLTGRVDIGTLKKDLAPDSHKCRLATIKHKQKIPIHEEKDWPSMVCSDTVYMEAVFSKPPVLASLECVRMNKQDVNAFELLAFKSLTSRLDDHEKLRSARYMKIRKILKDQNITLEVV